MAARVIIAPTTDIITTAVQFRVQNLSNPGIVAVGLTGTDTFPIFISVDGGIIFTAVQQGGSPLQLTATNNMFAIDAAGIYGATKTGSVLAGLFLTHDTQV